MFDKLKRLFPGSSGPEAAAAEAGAVTGPSDAELLACWQKCALEERTVEVFTPISEAPPAGVVLFLHGHGEILLSDNLPFTRLFQQHRLAAVCPAGKRSWWLDVVCDEFDSERTPQRWLIDAVVPWIQQRFSVEPPRIALLGISMGGQGALQLAYRHAMKFPVVAAISPVVDFQQLYGSGIPLDQMFPDAESARQATVVLNLHPLAWPRYQFFTCDPADLDWFDGCARLGMKLSSSGILHERDLTTTGGGHSWDYFNRVAPAALDHIAKGLERL